MLLARLRGLVRRPPVGVVVSLAIHLGLLAAAVLVSPPVSEVVVRRGEPLFIELAESEAPAPAGQPAARTAQAPEASRPAPVATPKPRPARADPPPAAARAPEPAPAPPPPQEQARAPEPTPPPALAPAPDPSAAEVRPPEPEPPPRLATAAPPPGPLRLATPAPPPEPPRPETPAGPPQAPETRPSPGRAGAWPAIAAAPGPPVAPAAPAPGAAPPVQPGPSGPQVAALPPSPEPAPAPPVDIRSALGRRAGGTADGRGGIEGEPIPLDTTDARYNDYFDRVRRMIKERWGYPCVKNQDTRECEYKTASLVVEFGIAKDGHVPFVTVRTSSGWKIYDDYAVNAIKLAAPFPRVPDSISRQGIPVLARFNYIVESSLTRFLW